MKLLFKNYHDSAVEILIFLPYCKLSMVEVGAMRNLNIKSILAYLVFLKSSLQKNHTISLLTLSSLRDNDLHKWNLKRNRNTPILS